MKRFTLAARKGFIVIALALFVFHFSLAQKITYSDSWNKAGFNLKEQTRGGVTVGYSVKEFSIVPADINGRSMQNIELPGYWLPNDEGAPNLPGGGRYIAIPKGSDPILKIVAQRTETYKNIDLAPAPRIPWDTERGPLQYKMNNEIYAADAYYPASPVSMSEKGQIRGVDVVMLGVTPFQYNPVTKELIVYRDLEIQIDFKGGNGQFGTERLRSRFWDPILSDALLNYASLPAVDYDKRAASRRASNGCDYLIIVPDSPDYMTWAQQIKTFRIQQGISTDITTLSEIGGNNTTMIENYINDAYANWDPVPAAVLLMGDYGTSQTNNILAPIWDNYCASDNIYADVDNDDLPDIVFARMTANDTTQLKTFCTKFMNYETNPPTSPDFYNHPITALGWQTERWFQICSEVVGGYFKNVQGKDPVRINEIYQGNPNSDPWSTAPNTSTVLDYFGPNGLGYIPDSPQQLGGWSGGNATMINNAINSGAFLLQHRDHGMETGWGEPSYTNPNIDGLTNTDLTFIFSINCLTGKYNWNSECFTEKFHRYRHNGVNSGALGVIGASETSYSFVNDTYVWGMFDNMWPDFMPQYGSNPPERGLLPAFGNAAGKYFLAQSSWPYNTENKVVTYHLFHMHGDAFQTLYSEVPQNLNIIHDPVILAGVNQFTITSDPGSTICLSVGDEIVGLADGTGSPVTIDLAPQTIGTMVHLTVTKTNYFRDDETIEVIPATGPYCVYDAYTIQDSTGNGNGLVDYNESVLLNLAVKNVGIVDGENITVTISTNDPFITLTDSTEFYGTIPTLSSVTVDNGFAFYAAENTPDQHQVVMNVVAGDGTNTWASLFTFKVNAPVLNINSLTINDQVGGNGDGELDPGESATMTINYTNSGHAVAYNVDVFLEGQSGFVDIQNPSQNFEAIGFLGLFNKTFDVAVDPGTPEGITVNFLNQLTMGNFYSEKNYPEKISAMIEDFETGNFTRYNWQFAGNQPWQTTLQYPYAGYFCAKSGPISNNQTSELKISYEVMSADSISFMSKVSSEPNDKLQFYIGSVLQGEWAGTTTGWTRKVFAVSPGNHTFRWVYAKNGSTTGGSDMSWLDNIHLPTPMCLTIWAGPDGKVCPGETFPITESYGTGYTTIDWSTAGTGTFDDNTLMTPVYTPGAEDIANGSVLLTLTLTDDNGNSVADETLVSFKSTPSAPPTPQGPDFVDLFQVTTSEYSTEGIEGISQYAWHLDPAEAGTIDGNGIKAIVTWNPSYLGTAYVSAAGINECGEGEPSIAFEVTVGNTVGLPDLGGAKGISIFPNPGNGNFQVTIHSAGTGIVTLKVFDLLGSKVYEDVLKVDGILHQSLNLQNLADGVYFLKVEGEGISTVMKIIKR